MLGGEDVIVPAMGRKMVRHRPFFTSYWNEAIKFHDRASAEPLMTMHGLRSMMRGCVVTEHEASI